VLTPLVAERQVVSQTLRMRVLFLLIAALLSLPGCEGPQQSGALVDGYRAADCVPVMSALNVQPPARAWNYTLKSRTGLDIHVSGVQTVGGRIVLKYLADGTQSVAADAGDYIYPSDVRVDHAQEKLYIKAAGTPAAFGGPQTWLFQYDLRQRHETARAEVDPWVLPSECSSMPVR
jgi:hypothetical protein